MQVHVLVQMKHTLHLSHVSNSLRQSLSFLKRCKWILFKVFNFGFLWLFCMCLYCQVSKIPGSPTEQFCFKSSAILRYIVRHSFFLLAWLTWAGAELCSLCVASHSTAGFSASWLQQTIAAEQWVVLYFCFWFFYTISQGSLNSFDLSKRQWKCNPVKIQSIKLLNSTFDSIRRDSHGRWTEVFW